MAYTPTNWVDNVTTLSPTNFNKMEQGIYNASVKADNAQPKPTTPNTTYGNAAMYSNTTGTNNTSIGSSSLYLNQIGNNNTAVGFEALKANTSGNSNVAVGSTALYSNTIGIYNTAIGGSALYTGATTSYNTAIGYETLKATTTSYNTAVGYRALTENTTGMNTAVGHEALKANTTGNVNVAVGMNCMNGNTTGTANIAIGNYVLRYGTSSCYNVAIGHEAANFLSDGTTQLISPDFGVYIGYGVKSGTADNNQNEIVIGYNARGYGSNTAHIGNSSVTSISYGPATGTAFTNRSDRRIKEDIIDADTSICYNDIKTLPLHRFKYKDYVGNTGDIHLTGFIADEFETKFPKAVIKNDQMFPLFDENGQPVMKTINETDMEGNEVTKEVQEYFTIEQVASIDTSQVTTTLVGAVQELMKKVESQSTEIESLKAEIVLLKNN